MVDAGLEQVRQLNPVTYYYNEDYAPNDQDLQVGFIAEDIAAINPLFATYNKDGSVENVRYDKLTTMLATAVQQLDVQVQNNDTRLDVVESGEFAGNLHVNGSAQFDGNLAVTGDTTLTKLTVTGDTEVQQLTVNGKIITMGDTPTAVLGAQATGQGAIVTISGNDTAGTINYEAGTEVLPTNPMDLGEQVNVEFTEPYTAQPRVTVTPTSEAAAKTRYYIVRSTTGFNLVFVDIPTVGQTYSYDYQIIQ